MSVDFTCNHRSANPPLESGYRLEIAVAGQGEMKWKYPPRIGGYGVRLDASDMSAAGDCDLIMS